MLWFGTPPAERAELEIIILDTLSTYESTAEIILVL